MKLKLNWIIVVIIVFAAGAALLRAAQYKEARSWRISSDVPAPIYEKDIYPYGSESPPNRITTEPNCWLSQSWRRQTS
jgi:hypothetical protein